MSIVLDIHKRKKLFNIEHKNVLDFWDLCFWQNFGIRVPFKNPKQTLMQVAEEKLKEFEKLTKSPEYFEIDSSNNPDLELHYFFAIKNYERHQEAEMAKFLIQFPQQFFDSASLKFSFENHKDFCRLFDSLKEKNFSPTFLCLMLNEMLTTLYKSSYGENNLGHKTEPRDVKKSLFGVMKLSDHILNFIYENGKNYSDFKKLYFDAIAYNTKQLNKKKNEILKQAPKKSKLKEAIYNPNLETKFDNLGHWIKICSKQEDPKNFETNLEVMQSILSQSPTCLSDVGRSYLKNGPVFIFVDKDLKPRISIDTDQKSFWEVEGNLQGHTVEKEYLDVAIEFFEKNINVNGAQTLLSFVSNIKQLSDFCDQIENGTFKAKDYKNAKSLVDTFDQTDFIDGNIYYSEKLKSLLPEAPKPNAAPTL